MISEELAKEVSFFSIGTNDLTQYTLAIDRQNQSLDTIYDSHHPAVLRMIQMTIENGHKGGAWVGVCGELGAGATLTKLPFLWIWGLTNCPFPPTYVLRASQGDSGNFENNRMHALCEYSIVMNKSNAAHKFLKRHCKENKK